MKYSELINFEPLTTVIKLSDNKIEEKKVQNVKSYVFSERMINSLKSFVIPNLDVSGKNIEQKGISVVGSFGTGKSHLMSVITSIAEDKKYLQYVQNDEIKRDFELFAGHYIVLSFEVGTVKPLYELVFYRIEKFLNNIGVDFHFNPESKDTYKEQLQQMMASFEEKFPDKHFLIIIDELLEYLKSRNAMDVNGDLITLRQLGEMCDGSRFKIIYGVQEQLYQDPLLQPAAKAIEHAYDRFSEILITKEDVKFVVKNRLLKKTPEQKQKIREHLSKFSYLFDGLNTDLNEYVELFPVHPSYISTFQLIKHGKDKREVLKILSYKFEELSNKDVPTDNPGLITYDSYFDELINDSAMLSIPDIAAVAKNIETIDDNIRTYFSSKPALKSKIPLAKRIANALAIKLLCDDLDKHLGASAFTLKEDLCITLSGIDEPDLLRDTIESVATNLTKATQGQFVVKDELSDDFYIRSKGGINVEQIIKDYVEYIKSNTSFVDQSFFNLLKFLLNIETNPYRTGFNIWSHYIEWKSTRSFRLGYIFFGNPNERSTTEPIQEFYMYFCPLFSKLERSDLDDEVYFDFSNFDEVFKNEVYLYSASMAKLSEASSDKKTLFQEQADFHRNKIKDLFNKNFADKMNVIYKGKSLPLKNYQLPQEGGSKLALFSDVAASILDDVFNAKCPEYPQFRDLREPNVPDNLNVRVRSALTKIIKYDVANRDGQAILAGLGLNGINSVDVQNSRYAASIKKKLAEKGVGKVLNREDVIFTHYQALNQYYSVDYKIEYQLEFVVLAALVFNGDIEISWNNDFTLTASNIAEKLLSLDEEQFFLFSTIKAPSDLPVKSLKKLFSCLGLPDLTANLKEASTFTKLGTTIASLCDLVAKTIADLNNGIRCNGISLVDENIRNEYISKLQNLLNVLDTVRNLDTFGKLKGFKYSEEELDIAFESKSICKSISNLKSKAEKFEKLITYLSQAESYVLESEKPLYDNIEKAIKELPEKLQADEKVQKQYESVLISLIDSYSEYYFTQYTKNRLNYSDSQKKDSILSSDKKQICEILKDITILNKTDFENWRNTITSLKPIDIEVTKEKIKENPYQEFNPRENYDKSLFSIRELEEQLDSTYSKWINAINATFNDPGIEQSLNMLSDEQKNLASKFRDGSVEITLDNARMMRDIINNISNGFEKIELTNDDFSTIFSKPMGIEQAKAAFDKFIEEQCAGKERNKIRIILSGK